MNNAILIIGHGSRSRDAQKTFESIINMAKIKEKDTMIFGAHMENASPDIYEVINQIYEQGIMDITIVPYFLYPGIHLKKDIPAIIKRVQEKYLQLNIKIAPPLGIDNSLVELLLKRSREI